MEYKRRVDGFKVQTEKTSKNDRTRDLTIVYYSNGEKYADSLKYKGVSEEKIEKVKEKMFKYTLDNLNCEKMSDVTPFLTIMSGVEKIIYG